MSYAAIMVHVDIDGLPEQRIRIASELSAKFDATLIGFSGRAVPPPFVAEGVVIEEATEADIARLKAALAAKGAWFRDIAGRPEAEWRWALDFPTEALASEARAADLLVIGKVKPSHVPYGLLAPGKLILNAGRPVLFVPDGVATLGAGHVVDRLAEYPRSPSRGHGCAALPSQGRPRFDRPSSPRENRPRARRHG